MKRERVGCRVWAGRTGRAAWARAAVLGALMVAGCAPSPGPATSGAAPAAPGPGGGGAPPVPVATAAVAPIHLLVNYAAVGPSQSGLWATYEGGYLREQGLDGELTNV